MEDAMLKVVALSLGLWFWQNTSAAQAIETGSLQGAVRDENGKPVTGAAVKIRNVERGITVTVFSRGGNYSAPGLFAGRSEVSAGMGGHAESAKADVEIAPGTKTLLNLALKRSAPILTPADWIAQLPDDQDGVKQLVINRCVNCHGPVNFVSRRFDRLGWKKVVIDMGRIEEIGPPNYKSISDEEAMASKSEEAERITVYLSKHFGPDKPLGMNVAKAVAYRNAVGEPDVVITQFDIPTRTAIPHNLTVDPRGHVWFVERYGEKIGGLDPKTGGFREFPIPAKVARPHGIVADSSGFVWWSESRGNHLGRLDSRSGEMKRTPLPQERSSPHTLFLASDGLIWMTQIRGNRVARSDPRAATFKEYAIPTKESRPYGIVVDSRNHVWFCEFTANKIGRFDPVSAKFSEFPLPGLDSQVRKMAVDQAGAVWLSEYKNSRMVRVVERR